MRSLTSLCICLCLVFSGSLCYQSIDLNKACEANASGLFMSDYGPNSAIQLWAEPRIWTADPDCTVNVGVPSLRGILACVNTLVFEHGCGSSEHLNLSSDADSHSLCESVQSRKQQRCFGLFRFAQLQFNTVSGKPPEFSITFNSFQVPPCGSGSYACDDETMCVWRGLVCDGIRNCLDSSDESGCAMPLRSVLFVIVGAVPVVLVCAMIAVYLVLNDHFAPRRVHFRRGHFSPRHRSFLRVQVVPGTEEDYYAELERRRGTVGERDWDGVRDVRGRDRDVGYDVQVRNLDADQRIQESDRHAVQGIQERDRDTFQRIQESDRHAVQRTQESDKHAVQGIQESDRDTVQRIQESDRDTVTGVQESDRDTVTGVQESDGHAVQGIQESDGHAVQEIQETEQGNQGFIEERDQNMEGEIDQGTIEERDRGAVEERDVGTIKEKDQDSMKKIKEDSAENREEKPKS